MSDIIEALEMAKSTSDCRTIQWQFFLGRFEAHLHLNGFEGDARKEAKRILGLQRFKAGDTCNSRRTLEQEQAYDNMCSLWRYYTKKARVPCLYA